MIPKARVIGDCYENPKVENVWIAKDRAHETKSSLKRV